jgi:biotin synthase
LVERVRVAFGTGVVLGLWDGRMETPPTIAHFLTYHDGRCSASCGFCPQARESTSDLKMLSRVLWPHYPLEKVLSALGKKSGSFQRICIQAVNYPGAIEDLCELVKKIKDGSNPPISVSCHPVPKEVMEKLEAAGVERICIPLDAATPEVFGRMKDGYSWELNMKAMKDAREVFGFRVTTHIIVGLGESEREAAQAIGMLDRMGVTVALFAFTPIKGTRLSEHSRPDLDSYHRIQLARHLISQKLANVEGMKFKGSKIVGFGVEDDILEKVVRSGEPFRTSGCPGCNRPFYNESPHGPIYNYPRKPTRKEAEAIQKSFLG